MGEQADHERRFSRERWREHRAVHRAERRALEAAYKELQRRLMDLNHAHAQMVSDRSEFVRYEAWKVAHDTLVEKIDLVNAGLIELRARGGGVDRAKESTRSLVALIISGMALVVTIVALVLLATHHS